MGFNTLPNQPQVFDGSEYVELAANQTLDTTNGGEVVTISETVARKVGASLIYTEWGPTLRQQRVNQRSTEQTPEGLNYSA